MDTEELLNRRAKTHGDYVIHAQITQALKYVLHEHGSKWNTLTSSQRESLEMILHKIGRIIAGDAGFKDHWDDIAGYAKLVADQCPLAKE